MACGILVTSEKVKLKPLSRVWLLATPWTVAYQAPLSMGFFQARILEWVAISYSRGSSWPRGPTCVSCIGRWILYHCPPEYCCHRSVAKLCPTFCNPIDCSTPGFPVLHYLPEFAQIHVHWVGEAIQRSHSLLPFSPLPSNLSQHQGLFLNITVHKFTVENLERKSIIFNHRSIHRVCRRYP